MGQQTIKFSIKQDGTVIEEVAGVVGNDCEKLTKTIEEKLGTVVKVQHKPEYYQQQTTQEDVTLQHHQD
tara:strand:- start:25 stop:231 length:207 start_codon:yes stop_codon:yes gene_type:complete